MQHIAILRKSWKLLEKIESGGKTIESRWYETKRAPYNRIKAEDIIYFKESASKVELIAKVSRFLQFSNFNQKKVKEIIEKYGRKLGISDLNFVFQRNKDKKYCILIFLKEIKKIIPFDIDKKGFGLMSAWICVDNINRIKTNTIKKLKN
jgi:ASC-1-like (ASCH) protein